MTLDNSNPSQGAPGEPPAPAKGVYRSAATAIAIAWSLRLIGLISVLVLARMLTPRDFGIVALATSVLALVDIFSALGLRQALLRIAVPERAHYDTAWTIQLLVLVVLAALLVAIGPVAAWFYEEPALGLLIAVLASCFVIDGLANIGVIDFERHFDFGRDMRMRLSVRLTSFVVTVSAALILQSYWALVIGTVMQSALNAVASYVFHPFRPRFSLAKREELLGVSLWMFLASAAQTVHNQIEKIVVGRISSRNIVGFYSVSRDLSSIFTEEIGTALNRVTFVTTARTGRPLSADPERLPSMLGAYGLIAAPLGFGLAATADEALPLLLGSQWTAAAPLLAIIAPACALYAVYKLIVITLQASGDARAAALLSVAGAASVVAVTVTLGLGGYGAASVALGALIATTALLASGLALLSHKAETGIVGLLTAVARPFAAATLMMLVVQSLDTGNLGPLAAMAIKAPLGAAIFGIAVIALWLGQGGPDGAEKTMISLVRQRSRQFLIKHFARM
ncbi:oligosaccharide flippase family protein [Parasphingopyxis lamellibrachiae]|uniref:O-antigen/teichoic acid export membrane protein n=1 Tax=Parasphingopyxis lamellibrachiae TaxID=680125 RepID=A0A3D9FFQ5_9SPHN|nr:oligosaccharide flippase family protein [Parasphingopyxis lamellibrachiae]RED16655.1 O-antigen/teichoic acid export membrane protein [Parasphingopyxis lamellibrachiae]